MNIKITKEEHLRLMEMPHESTTVGSHMYGTTNENSDKDYLHVFYPTVDDWFKFTNTLPSIHQFQYDDEEKNEQHIWTTQPQFIKNMKSGDSTINVDVILFSNYEDRLGIEFLYNYKIIKAYIGFAKRDLKNIKGKNKRFHVERGLYCAECLLNKELPTLKEIQRIHTEPMGSVNDLRVWERRLREDLNGRYDRGEITTYSISETNHLDSLLAKLILSNNIKEFKYV